MTWYAFGIGPSDWTFVSGTVTDTGSTDVTVPVLVAGTLTFWNLPSGGTQLTVALDSDGVTQAMSITSSDGSDGFPVSTVGRFWAQQVQVWADGGAGGRLLMTTTDAAAIAAAAASTADANADAVIAIQAELANVMMVAVADDSGTFPARPSVASGHVVAWIGPSFPSGDTGNTPPTGAVQNDLLLKYGS